MRNSGDKMLAEIVVALEPLFPTKSDPARSMKPEPIGLNSTAEAPARATHKGSAVCDLSLGYAGIVQCEIATDTDNLERCAVSPVGLNEFRKRRPHVTVVLKP
jgi:hypothetical protein